jgi:hypothetical protein
MSSSYENGLELLDSINIGRISSIAEQLLTSQEELISIEQLVRQQ